MNLELYELCAGLFLLHGVGTPILFVATGLVLRAQSRERDALESLGASVFGKRGAGRSVGARLASLPKLEPLACARCGAPLVLGENRTECRHCATTGPLPDDYRAASALHPITARLVARANRSWRWANVLTHPVTRAALVAMLILQPLLFLATAIGSSTLTNTPLDRAFERLGETGGAVVMGMAMIGFVIWMIIYGMLASLGRELRRKLPVVPVLREARRGRELARCEGCGGGIEYVASAFAALCDYCHTASYRARFVRRERASIEADAREARDALFGAMDIVAEFTWTLFLLLMLLGALPMLAIGIGMAMRS